MLLRAALLLVAVAVPPSVSSYERSLQLTLRSQYQTFCEAGRAAAAEAQRGSVPLIAPGTDTALMDQWKSWVETLRKLSLLLDVYANVLAHDDPAFEQRHTSIHQALRESGRLLSLAGQQGAFMTLAAHGEEVAQAVSLVR